MNKMIERIKEIEKVYKKSFYIICGIAFLVFFREIISLRWGNHDWYSVLSHVPIYFSFCSGRFSSVILQFLTGFKCITYISNILYLMGLILGLMLLSKYWEIPKKVSNIVIFVLFYLLMPSTLCFMYYKSLSINFGFGLFFVVLSILTSIRIGIIENKKEKVIYFLISYVSLFVFVLGAYQPFINTILVILSGKLLINYIESGYKLISIKEYIKEHKYFFIVLVLSVVSEFLVICYLKYLNIFEEDFYNVKLINFNVDEIKEAFINTINILIYSFTSTYPYIGMYVKVLLLIIVILSIIYSIVILYKIENKIQLKITKSMLLISLFILTAWLSLFSYFISPGISNIEHRINSIGFNIFYLLCLGILIKFVEIKILKKVVIIISLLIIYNSGINSIYAQQISELAFQSELKFNNRVLSKIESHPNFSYDREYKYLKIGFYNSLKNKFYSGTKYNNEFFEFSYNDSYESFIYSYLTPYNLKIYDNFYDWERVYNYLKENSNNSDIKELNEYILNKAKVWPHEDSVYVSDKYIVVVFDEEILEKTKEVLLEKQNKIVNE